MPYNETIRQVVQALTDTFDEVCKWSEQPSDARVYRPLDRGWSIDEILEHISLTTHFLVIVARNGTEKALRRATKQKIEGTESDLTKLLPIGQRGSFLWIRPEHMEPQGGKQIREILAVLRQQQNESLGLLEKLKNGEGSLFLARMSVNESGHIDLYQWLYFIAQHAQRHIGQMEENLEEWRKRRARRKTSR